MRHKKYVSRMGSKLKLPLKRERGHRLVQWIFSSEVFSHVERLATDVSKWERLCIDSHLHSEANRLWLLYQNRCGSTDRCNALSIDNVVGWPLGTRATIFSIRNWFLPHLMLQKSQRFSSKHANWIHRTGTRVRYATKKSFRGNSKMTIRLQI